jgi:hypothetical protein
MSSFALRISRLVSAETTKVEENVIEEVMALELFCPSLHGPSSAYQFFLLSYKLDDGKFFAMLRR